MDAGSCGVSTCLAATGFSDFCLGAMFKTISCSGSYRECCDGEKEEWLKSGGVEKTR
jgi:hypothetical protein